MPVKNKNRHTQSGFEGEIVGLTDKEKQILEDTGIGGGGDERKRLVIAIPERLKQPGGWEVDKFFPEDTAEEFYNNCYNYDYVVQHQDGQSIVKCIYKQTDRDGNPHAIDFIVDTYSQKSYKIETYRLHLILSSLIIETSIMTLVTSYNDYKS